MNFLERVAQSARDNCSLHPRSRLLVGVSGGLDSMVLLDALHRLGYPLIVAHFNHHLRPEAEQDADFVRGQAAGRGLPFVYGQADVRAFARREKRSLEDAARVLRYRFLFAQARAHEAQAVAVAHQADDQAETVLLHLLRGAGLDGLRGMAWRWQPNVWDKTLPLVRPLLAIWRHELQAWAAAQGLTWREDASNRQVDFTRNRVRHEILPALKTVNAQAGQALWRLAQMVQPDAALLSELAETAWEQVVVGQGEGWLRLDARRLADYPSALMRRVARQALLKLNGFVPAAQAVLQMEVFFTGRFAGAKLSLPGDVLLQKEGDSFLLWRESAQPTNAAWPQMPRQGKNLALPCPGEVILPQNWRLAAEMVSREMAVQAGALRESDSFVAWLSADGLETLSLRPPAAGMRFPPLGMSGQVVKLQDIFVNLKIPARLRALWPLVFSGETLAWVPGYRLAEGFRITNTTRLVCRLNLKRSDDGIF